MMMMSFARKGPAFSLLSSKLLPSEMQPHRLLGARWLPRYRSALHQSSQRAAFAHAVRCIGLRSVLAFPFLMYLRISDNRLPICPHAASHYI